ncbi:MAG: cytochrome c family protein [Proteobacteria bacterium]|nr:cytochrome c family protein [Pseudomonadota bacterium]
MGSDPLFLNKVIAAIISAVLLAMTAAFITGFLYKPKMLDKQVYAIGGGTVVASMSGATAPEKAGPEPIAPMLAQADVAAGQKVSKKCSACHTFQKDGKHRIGPNLWNIVGAKQGGKDGYAYSKVFKGLGADWSYEELNKFLFKPRAYARGTKMSFVGLRKAGDRAAMIAYLRSLSDSPKELP